MQLDALLWMFLPVFVAAGSALLSFYIMQAKMEVAIAKERKKLAEARATITSQKVAMEERVKAVEESTRRKAYDEFMQDFRVEERSYMRETKSVFNNKRMMILQERLFFRNIPLSNWVEHEMLVEEGGDPAQLAKSATVFTTRTLTEQTVKESTVSKLVTAAAEEKAVEKAVTLPASAVKLPPVERFAR